MEQIEAIAEVKQRALSNTRRIETLEEGQAQLHELVTSVAVIAQKQNEMSSRISQISHDVKQITEKPGRRWDNAVTQIINVLIAAILGFLLVKIGL